VFQERYDDPEVQGSKIALIAVNSKTVQKPANCLDRMTSRFLKQVAYNERVLRAEDEIATISCDIADFSSGLSSSGTITVCINSGPTMKKDDPVIGGQFWQQEDRSMTEVNAVIPGTPNTRESVILAAAVEAVEWTHPIEPRTAEGKRVAPRVVIYPAEIPQIEEAISDFKQDPSEHEDGSHTILSKLVEKCEECESPPRFIREDSSEITDDPVLSASVPIWMNTAEQISVGSRPLVREDGPDVMNSSDEDSVVEEHGDILTGMYKNDLQAPVLLSRSEVARQGAVHDYAVSVGYGKWIDSGSNCPSESFSESDQSQSVPSSPANSRSGSRFDTPNVPRAQTPTGEVPPKSTVSTTFATPPSPKESSRQKKRFMSDSSGASGEEMPPPAVLISSRVVPSSEVTPPAPKRSSASATSEGEGTTRSRKKTAIRSTDTGISGSEHPMATRSRAKKASRAGGLRGESGSGATDTSASSAGA
jgi:hypothetical protein